LLIYRKNDFFRRFIKWFSNKLSAGYFIGTFTNPASVLILLPVVNFFDFNKTLFKSNLKSADSVVSQTVRQSVALYDKRQPRSDAEDAKS